MILTICNVRRERAEKAIEAEDFICCTWHELDKGLQSRQLPTRCAYPLLSHLRNSSRGERVEFIIEDDKDLADELKARMADKGPGE